MNQRRIAQRVSGLARIVTSAFAAVSCFSPKQRAPQPIYPAGNKTAQEYAYIVDQATYTFNTVYNNTFLVRRAGFQASGWGPPVETAYDVEILRRTTPQELAKFLREYHIDEEATPERLERVETGTKLRYVRHFMPASPIWSM